MVSFHNIFKDNFSVRYFAAFIPGKRFRFIFFWLLETLPKIFFHEIVVRILRISRKASSLCRIFFLIFSLVLKSMHSSLGSIRNEET